MDDFFKSIIANESLYIRNPNSTRPWQHVLEPLNGYMQVAKLLHNKKIISGESFNFGPIINNHVVVSKLIQDLSNRYQHKYGQSPKVKIKKNTLFENNFLRLNIAKSQKFLGWKPILSYSDMINFTCDWYATFINSKKNIHNIMEQQINFFNKKN